MNKLLILIFVSISVACLGQKKSITAKAEIPKTLTPTFEVLENRVPTINEKTILFSKGEAFTEKEWQEYRKQVYPIVKEFFKRDSTHNKFLSNTVAPNLMPGDTIESYNITLEGIFLKLKQKRK